MTERFSNIESKENKKTRHARLSYIRENPQIAALVNKITPSGNESDGDREARLNSARPSDYTLTNVSAEVSQSIKDADLIFQLLPELVLVKQILISSILSPKDLVNSEINYSNSDSGIPNEISSGLIEIVRDYFENVYKIKRILPKILEDALFDTGSYPLAILPESSIDKIINSTARTSLEGIADEFDEKGIVRSIGVLGRNIEETETVKYGIESIFAESGVSPLNHDDYKLKAKSKDGKDWDMGIEVYDNFQYLKIPELKKKITEQRMHDIIAKRNINASLEDLQQYKDVTDLKIESSFYKRKPTTYEGIVRIDESTPERPSIGNPLTMKLPSEACIPVYVPGNPRDHLGYFVILDATGNPLSNATSSDYYRQMGFNLYNNTNQVASQLIGSTNVGTNGTNPEVLKQKFQEAVNVYTNTVEKDLLKRLKNGVYGENVQISKASEIYRIMFSRTLVNKRTQLLFIPRELLTYFAFDYNDDGVGKSLTEKSKVLSSIRSVLLFANTMASIKNSIGRTSAKITLDPKDRNPTETVEFMMHEFARHRRSTFPFGTYNPVDLVSYLANAGIDIAVTGNPGYPETAFDVEHKQNNVTKPDTELEESFKKRHIQSFGLAPETVDLSMGVDFATSVVSSNLLLSKRVLMYQEIFTEQLQDFHYKYTINSGALLEKMKKVIVDNKDKLTDDLKSIPVFNIIQKFLSTLIISLPAPDSITLDNQMAAYDKYKEALEKALDAYFNTEFLETTTMGDLSEAIGPTKEALKAHFLRRWLAENNVLPELADITMLSEDKDNEFSLLDIMDNHIEGLQKTLKPYMDKIKERAAKLANADDSGGGDMGGGAEDTGGGDSGFDDTGTDTTDDTNPDDGADEDFSFEPDGDTKDETPPKEEEKVVEEESSTKTETDTKEEPAKEKTDEEKP